MAEILLIRRKTLSNQSIDLSVKKYIDITDQAIQSAEGMTKSMGESRFNVPGLKLV